MNSVVQIPRHHFAGPGELRIDEIVEMQRVSDALSLNTFASKNNNNTNNTDTTFVAARAWPASISAPCLVEKPRVWRQVPTQQIAQQQQQQQHSSWAITRLPTQPTSAARVTISIVSDSSTIISLGFVFAHAHPSRKRKVAETHSQNDYIKFTRNTIVFLLDNVTLTKTLQSDQKFDSEKELQAQKQQQIRSKHEYIPAGLESAFNSLYDLIMLPLLHSELVKTLNTEYPKGVLLWGPPGVGKTMLVTAVAKCCGTNLITMNGSEIFGTLLGETEERIRAKFDEASSLATKFESCILFIDEIDSIAPNRNESLQTESRMVATLLTLLDGVKSRQKLIVIGATNRPNAIDAALRRPGRLDREIAIDTPNEVARLWILKSLTIDRGMAVDENIDLNAIAVSTNGYVGADLAALCREAAIFCLEHDRERVSQMDFVHALSVTTPSTIRGYSVNVPGNLTWDSVGGLDNVKLKLKQCVEWPITRRDVFLRLGLKPPRGVLLYGPPGCSKTTLVKIIACTSNATFLSINGATLYSPFVGDSEASVRALFQRARLSSPSVIFFDEIDAIVGSRDLSGVGDRGSRDTIQESVLSTLLNEMDGIEAVNDVLVVGATNRPDMIDAALMRPGRFDKIIYVPPPNEEARLKILEIYSKCMPMSGNINLSSIAKRTSRFTGADLESLCREAAFAALRESQGAGTVEMHHFEDALFNSVKPSLSWDMIKQYEGLSSSSSLSRNSVSKIKSETRDSVTSASTTANHTCPVCSSIREEKKSGNSITSTSWWSLSNRSNKVEDLNANKNALASSSDVGDLEEARGSIATLDEAVSRAPWAKRVLGSLKTERKSKSNENNIDGKDLLEVKLPKPY
ncbi:hypothetical protein HK100_000502 [Physocladia obscura]|uniref:AAA+ ATPase domain-containing protein n=1 Tax=Physocladia obscura TaxID=109957 RepID=A0AAD5T847_9FUNG|nr:hypothetical protein HK100_000502 [Physocladia obscura]